MKYQKHEEIKDWQMRYQIEKKYWQNYYLKNRERIIAYSSEYGKAWRAANPERIKYNGRSGIARKRKECPRQRYYDRGRVTINHMLTRSKGSTTTTVKSKYIGCTGKQLRSHLEALWLPNMDWSNYGRGGWYVAQIVPLSAFTPDKWSLAFHYTNLEPRWYPVIRKKKAV